MEHLKLLFVPPSEQTASVFIPLIKRSTKQMAVCYASKQYAYQVFMPVHMNITLSGMERRAVW